jgi:predicted Zn-dependent protease
VTTLSDDARQLMSLLAYIYLENDRPEKCSVLLAALDALGQADTRARTTLALAQVRAGKPQSALATLDGLAMSGAVDAVFHLIRAQTLQALDRRDEASAAMRAYVALRPQDLNTDPAASSGAALTPSRS